MNTNYQHSLDNRFANINSLKWYPWVGENYKTSKHKILIVGESHYSTSKERAIFLNANNVDHFLTRQCITESALNKEWSNRTLNNIYNTFSNTFNTFKDFWKSIAYYNFISRVMDNSIKGNYERPSWNEFYNGWECFCKVVEILQPDICIFIGVSASNSFNNAMTDANARFTYVKWENKINNCFPRLASLLVLNSHLPIVFIKHCSKMYSSKSWQAFLKQRFASYLISKQNNENRNETEKLNTQENIPQIGISEYIEWSIPHIDLPLHLKHKPIILSDYVAYTEEIVDAKYISIGKAQYNNNVASVKFWRYVNNKWSRQSEEVPIDRISDMTLLLLATINKTHFQAQESSILNEKVIKNNDLCFLKEQINFNKERIKTSLIEMKALLNNMDLDHL